MKRQEAGDAAVNSMSDADPLPHFETRGRDYTGIASPGESNYSFLNRSAWVNSSLVRRTLESWFADYPDAQKQELKNRFVDKDERQHLGALFELYCHALGLAQGFTVTCAPAFKSLGALRPDFLLEKAGRESFILECTVACESEKEHRGSSRANSIHEAAARVQAPFYVYVKVEQEGLSTPSQTEIRKQIELTLGNYNPDSVIAAVQAGAPNPLPTWTWRDDRGWQVRFRAMPKPKLARGSPKVQPIVAPQTYWSSPDSGIPEVVQKKATKYESTDLPLVVGLNYDRTLIDEHRVAEALFGQCGMWATEPPKLDSHRRVVSAVLVVSKLVVWSVGAYNPVLWHNPWAARPLPADTWLGPQYVAEKEAHRITRIEGLSAPELLGLEEKWKDVFRQ